MKHHFGTWIGSNYSGVTLDEDDIARIRSLPPRRHAPAVVHVFFAIMTILIMAFTLWATTVIPPGSGGTLVATALIVCAGMWWFFAWVAKNARL